MNEPEMILVKSTSIESVGYAPEAQELLVQFVGSATYAYKGVRHEVFIELLNADSKGTFVNTKIKPIYTDYRRVR